jgi:hypothetical protein
MSITGLASETRHATRIARTEAARGKEGAKGAWTVDLGIDGLSEERREELIARLNKHLGLTESKKVGDGRLHSRCRAHDIGFHGATTFGLVELDRMLREIGGLDYGNEILTSSMTFSVTPDETMEEPSAGPSLTRGQKIAGKLLRHVIPAKALPGLIHTGYGVGVAASTEIDRGMRQRHGDHDYVITGTIDGLESVSADLIRAKAAEIGLSKEVIENGIPRDESFNLVVRVDKCGTAIGALLIFLRNMGQFLLLMPASASMKVDVDLLEAD